MKHIIAAVAAVCTAFAVYLVGSFIAWDMNPGNWSIDGRFTVALFGLVYAGIAAAISSEGHE
jgi:hypothetical protein